MDKFNTLFEESAIKKDRRAKMATEQFKNFVDNNNLAGNLLELASALGTPRCDLYEVYEGNYDVLVRDASVYDCIGKLLFVWKYKDLIHKIESLKKDTANLPLESNEDEHFLDNVNQNLAKDFIDKQESMIAKKTFDEDIENGNSFIKDVKQNYEDALKESQIELFGDAERLDDKPLDELKFYIFLNGWGNEFDTELLVHKPSVLLFLYRKLQERMEEKLKPNNIVSPEEEAKTERLKKEVKKRDNELDFFGDDALIANEALMNLLKLLK